MPVLRDRDPAARPPERRLEEAVGLAAAIDLEIVDTVIVPVQRPNPATLIGGGAADAIKERGEETGAGLVIVDSTLSSIQQRNLERRLKTKVIDRTGLILEIFGERARTREGQLQVELAHLSYQRSRLVRSWTHLERQRGGAGFMGGPGERQIELDRRLIDERIVQLKRDLGDVRRMRGLHRGARARVPYPVLALVGYTNAGKSTLFNRLTRADVLAKDLLFATLDPTMRLIDLGGGRKAILSDTVGFISDLPTHLVAAFRATLEEVQAADIILHVRDVPHPDTEAQRSDVNAVLADLGVDGADDERVIEVWNKMDLLPEAEREAWLARAERDPDVALISALAGEGVDRLLRTVAAALDRGRSDVTVRLAPTDGRTLAWLYENGDVLDRLDEEDGIRLLVRLSPENVGRLARRAPGALVTGPVRPEAGPETAKGEQIGQVAS